MRTRTRAPSRSRTSSRAAPQKLLIVATTTLGTIGALALSLTSFQSFLFLLGSFFVPLFAVLLADWLLAGRSYDADDVFGAPSWRPGLIAAWVVGFGTYQWLSPTGPTWWVEQVQRLDPPSWGIGATLPSFVAAFTVGLCCCSDLPASNGGAHPARLTGLHVAPLCDARRQRAILERP